MSADSPSGETTIPMIHEGFDWPIIPGLTLEHVIALGRCGNPEAFYNMMQSGLHAKGKCPFCDTSHLKGEIVYSNAHAYAFIPPGIFNRHQGALRKKFVIALRRHTSDMSTLSNAETIALQRCRRYLKKHYGCYNKAYGGISYMRYGSTIFNAGTVIGHLHENVDEPNGRAGIRPPVYKDEASWKKDHLRLSRYLVAYQSGMTQDEYVKSYSIHHDYQQ